MTGRFMPTESRSEKPIFRPEDILPAIPTGCFESSGGNQILDGWAGQAKTSGYRSVGDTAAVNIQTYPEMGILRHCFQAMAGDRQAEW